MLLLLKLVVDLRITKPKNNFFMKIITVKVTFLNGFGIEKVEAKTFIDACVKLEKKHAKNFQICIGFELVSIK